MLVVTLYYIIMMYMNLPPEMYVYILSFLEPHKYNLFSKKKNKKCICYTNNSNFKIKCKMKTKNVFCHLHNSLSVFNTLEYLQKNK